MQVKFFRSLWGMAEGATWEEKLRLIAEAGYDGVEFDPPADVAPREWIAWCAKYGLAYIAAIYALTPGEFADNLERAAAYAPLLVNSQTGRDRYSFDEGCVFFEQALRAEERTGVPVAHETHRHRLLFTPWTTAAYLERFPELKICADYSHWVLVTESRLGDMEDLVALASSRALHVHGRVGYEEGPQAPDPRAPEFVPYVELFDRWWDGIRAAKRARGVMEMTFTPEYGPPNYLHTLPYTQQPVANLWDICLWSMQRLRQRWGA